MPKQCLKNSKSLNACIRCLNIIATSDNQSDYIHELMKIFFKIPDISIDYVFEKNKIAKVLLIMFDWSDMGTWPMIWKNFSEKDRKCFDRKGRHQSTLIILCWLLNISKSQL